MDKLTLALAVASHRASGTELPAELREQVAAANRRAILRRVSGVMEHAAMGGAKTTREMLAQYETTPEALAVFLMMTAKNPETHHKEPLYTLLEVRDKLAELDMIPQDWRFPELRRAFHSCRNKRLPQQCRNAVKLQLVEAGLLPGKFQRGIRPAASITTWLTESAGEMH